MERWCHTTVNPSLLLLLLVSMTTTMAHDASDPSLNLTMGFQALNFLLASDAGSSTHNNNGRPPPYARNNDVTSTTLIRKGTEASDAMFPYMVSLQVLWTDNRLYHICGGVLFTPNKLLTAAHCMIYWGVYEHFAALGVQHISLGGEALIRVENATIHPDFDSSVSEFPWDIAVLALETDAVITSKVQLATLATFQDPAFEDLDECEIMGWGSTMMGDVPDSLHFAIMKGISNNDCRRFLRIFRYRGLQQYHKCAWNWPHGSCQGDSGGPLVCQGLVVGISSWGVTGCTGCFPSVYSKVAYHNGWIHLQ